MAYYDPHNATPNRQGDESLPIVVLVLGGLPKDIPQLRELCSAGSGIVIGSNRDVVDAWGLSPIIEGRSPAGAKPHIHIENLRIDRIERRVQCNEIPIRVTEQELRILLALGEEPGRAVGFSDLAQSVWGSHYGEYGDSLRSAIKRLRRKLTRAGADIQIEAVWGFGFRLSSQSTGLTQKGRTDSPD